MSAMILALSLLVTALAVARVTRLIVTDSITIKARMIILKRSGDTGWLTMLFHCPYCMSVWVGFIAAPLWWAVVGLPWISFRALFFIPALAMAFAQVTSFTTAIDKVGS